MEIVDMLRLLNISDSKIAELEKKPVVMENIRAVSRNKFNKLQYSLACTAPKEVDIGIISDLIQNGVIRHESILRGIYKVKVAKKSNAEVEQAYKDFILSNDKSKKEISDLVHQKKDAGLEKAEILREIKKAMPYIDFKVVMEELEGYKAAGDAALRSPGRPKPVSDDTFKWLEEGEVAHLHCPEENRQETEEILRDHLERTGGKVITRFPPAPSGCLHIGHAKALNLSFEYARKFGGKTYLRFDDTNPKDEKMEHVVSILEDIKWLGFAPCEVTASSDHFEKMMELSKQLIIAGKAYVCELGNDEVRNRRQAFQRERDIELERGGAAIDYRRLSSILSPYRNVSAAENLQKLEQMLRGEFGEGEAVLRFKMPLESKNPLMLDLVGARVINCEHPIKNQNYIVYPSYEFALCVCDSLEDVTHSFCSREFFTRQEPYHWLLRELGMYEPVQWEFSRLNISNAILSKRKFNELIKRGLGWDDPRFYTIKGMRRRGFPAKAINSFVRSVGITFSESIIDVKILESFVAKELFVTAKRASCVTNPLKINVGIKKAFKADGVEMYVNRAIYIDASDFSENPEPNFLRLTPENPVGLMGIGALRFVDKQAGAAKPSDGSPESLVCEIIEEGSSEYVKPKKFIQWIPNLDYPVELRMYTPLFKSFDPEETGYLNDIDLENSLRIQTGYCDGRILGCAVEDKFQFLRIGYFCCDSDSDISKHKYVFNSTIGLKSGYL